MIFFLDKIVLLMFLKNQIKLFIFLNYDGLVNG